MADPEILKNELQEYICSSNDVVHFKLVREPKDLEDDHIDFLPEFSHQLFTDSETIFGYKNLKVKLYYSACQLEIYLGMEYKESITSKKHLEVQADDVLLAISEKLPDQYHTSIGSFKKCLENEKNFKPFGVLLDSFTIEKGSSEREFVVYQTNYKSDGYLDYHDRLQTFILWFIDAASYIDSEDEKWDFFTMYEKYTINNAEHYAFVGFSTIYKYYAYPTKVRPRISQMMVLPPFQKKGLGPKLLQIIYNTYTLDANVLDITVEDPSDNFIRMRDLLDCQNCLNLHSFQPKHLKKGYSAAMKLEAQTKLKINQKQSRRCYEILRLKCTNMKNKEEYRVYRLHVKNRLNAPFKRQSVDEKKVEKIFTPAELALHLSNKSEQVKHLEIEYDDLEMEYRKIIERLQTPKNM